MKITIQVNGKDTEIELTAEQVAHVKKATQKITDRIKTMVDVFADLGKTTTHVSDKLEFLVESLNEGWTPDWSNSRQYKYTPYFKWNGTGFSYDIFNCWDSATDVSSRLCFKSAELAEYAGKQFEKEYNEYLNR